MRLVITSRSREDIHELHETAFPAQERAQLKLVLYTPVRPGDDEARLRTTLPRHHQVKIWLMIIRGARSIRGRIAMSGDKSISHRAAMIAALADGTSSIRNFSRGADCEATLSCLKALGISIERAGADLLIAGAGREGLRHSEAPLDCGNSGTTMRLLAGILAGQNFKSTLSGDDSLRSRPMQRIIEPLQMMGAVISSQGGRAPLEIQGHQNLNAISYQLLVASAQVKSCILLAGLSTNGRTEIIENEITRDHTERMLRHFGAQIETGDAQREGEHARFAAVNSPPP